ncbi:hypothetical protein MPLB_1540107 [Mesorhizobium sp. ORS 3324]|nr:hypothetical protein MPLB_1540107 [Mesorhizobium sp. ORS 3324]
MALHNLSKMLLGIMQAWPAFLRVASKGVYAGGGSIAEGSRRCKPSSWKPWRRQVSACAM